MPNAAPYDRDRALDAAMTVFWRKGYHATSLKDLEAALQMKPGSIYAAFKSKENLYLAALDRYSENAGLLLHSFRNDSGSALSVLRDFFRSFARRENDAPNPAICFVVKTMLDEDSLSDSVARAAEAHYDQMRDEITELFDLAKQQGEISPESDVSQLSKRYQMNLTALRVEAQISDNADHILAIAETYTRELDALRTS